MAITFDAGSGATNNGGSSVTASHVVSSGSNRILWGTSFSNGAGDVVTGMTYGGVAMTLARKENALTTNWLYIYYLVAPTVGTANLVVSASTTVTEFNVMGASFFGALQTGLPDATSTTSGGSSPISGSITTVADRSVVVMIARNTSGPNTASTNSTEANAQSGASLFYSTAMKTPAGSTSMNATYTGGGSWGTVMASFAPASSSYALTQSPLLVAATPSYFSTATSIAALNITGDITLEAWIKITSLPSDRATIIGRNTGGAYKTYNFEIEKSGANYNLRLVRSLAGTPTTIVSKASWNPSLATWYHVAATHNTTTGAAEIIIGGVSAATATVTGTSDADNASTFVGTAGFGASFDGRISLARIWNIKRSESEIAANVCTVFGAPATGLQAEWSLNNVLTDGSGNGSTLTNVSSVVFAVDTPSTCAIGPASVKTINGLAIASVKTVNDLSIGSVKNVNGLA